MMPKRCDQFGRPHTQPLRLAPKAPLVATSNQKKHRKQQDTFNTLEHGRLRGVKYGGGVSKRVEHRRPSPESVGWALPQPGRVEEQIRHAIHRARVVITNEIGNQHTRRQPTKRGSGMRCEPEYRTRLLREVTGALRPRAEHRRSPTLRVTYPSRRRSDLPGTCAGVGLHSSARESIQPSHAECRHSGQQSVKTTEKGSPAATTAARR